MSGWVHVFAIKMLSIILPLESNPWKIILHVSTFIKTEYYKVIILLIVVIIALETCTVMMNSIIKYVFLWKAICEL